MKLENIVQRTGVVNDRMTISEGFEQCVKDNVPGIPSVDSEGKVVGCFSIRKTLLSTCIPEIMVEYADLLGDDFSAINTPEKCAHNILLLPANTFVSKNCISITSDTSISKVIALMEKHQVNYLFVIDDEDYIGVITIDGIALRMLEIGKNKN